MKKVLLLTLITITLFSCNNKNQENTTPDTQIESGNPTLSENKEVNPESEKTVEPVYVKQFTEEDRYFSLDRWYMCDVYSGLSGFNINGNILTYDLIEDVSITNTEQKISLINQNGIDFIKLSKKFPKELTTEYRFGDSKDIQTSDKILFLAGNTEKLGKLLYAYTKGFKTKSFTTNRSDELYFCLFKDASSYLVENEKEYKLENLHDRRLETPWVEGVPGDGIGEGFTISFNMSVVNPTLLLMNGYISFDKPYLYEQNNRIKKIKVTGLKSGKEKILDVIDTPHPQTVDISFITENEDLRVEIVDVYKGTKYDDTCLQYCSTYYDTVIPYKSK